MANQVVAGLVGAAIGVMATTAIAISVRPNKAPECAACPQPAPQTQPQTQPSQPLPAPLPQTPPQPFAADAGVAEADIDGGADLGDVTVCDMDEVACLLADRPAPCCTLYGSSRRMSGGGSGSGSAGPTSLTAPQIRTVVQRLRSRIARCAEESDAPGTVRAQVKVAPDGTVANVVIKNAPDDALAQCVAHIMRSARFPRSDLGVSFTYPFVF